jgi:hypothetical protein
MHIHGPRISSAPRRKNGAFAQHPGHELCDVGDCFLTAQQTK